jgi:hypothetical protein
MTTQTNPNKLLITAPTLQTLCKQLTYNINSKFQKQLVDVLKTVVKSGKKSPADQKLRSLKLLNKAVCKAESNPEFLIYVQKKAMDRLTIFA